MFDPAGAASQGIANYHPIIPQLCLLHMLTSGSPHRLDLAESIRVPNRSGPRRNPFEAAMAEAERQEAQHGPPEELPFTATILCVGIAGTGKTATINNLLGRPAPSNFAEGTKKVHS